MKKLATTLGVMVLVGVMAVPAFAGRGGWGDRTRGPGNCQQWANSQKELTEDQLAKMDELGQKFYANTSKLRHEVWAKSDDLDILLNSSDPDPKKAEALQKEISQLRGKMAQKRLEYNLEAGKIAPGIQRGRGLGRQHHKRHGNGPGSYMNDYRRGQCWD